MNNKRIEWIDALKGFAIFLIVFGHTIGYSDKLSELSRYLSSFYVPLFFLISGYLFKNNKDESIKSYIKRKAKKILIPYYIFALLSLIPFYLFAQDIQGTLGSNRYIPDNIFKSVFYILYASGHSKGLSQNSPLWFLPCYFSVVVIGKIISTKAEKLQIKNKELLISFLFLLVGGIVYKFLNYPYPYCLETALVMLYFYFLGNFLRKINIKTKTKKIITPIVLLILGFIVNLANGRISCMNNDYVNSYLIFIVSASLTTTGYLFLFKLIKPSKILKNLGKHTIPILVMHKMPLIIFQSKIPIISNQLKHGTIYIQILTSFLIAFLTIITCIIFYKITVKWLPIIYGEDKQKPYKSKIKVKI